MNAAARGARPAGGRHAVALAVLALALVVRLPVLGWGLPDATHPHYTFHPDEPHYLRWGDLLYEGQIIAKHFQYGGTLYWSSLHASNELARAITPADRSPVALTFVLGRAASLLFSLLTVVLTYLAARTLTDRGSAALAALAVALAPAAVFWAGRIRPDAMFAFEFALNLWIMARLLAGRGSAALHCALGGLALGATVATRFPGAVLACGYLYALLASRPRGAARLIALGTLAATAGYLIASPHTLLYPEQFLEGLRVQWAYQSRPESAVLERAPGWWVYGAGLLPQAVGFAAYPLLLAALAHAAWRRSRAQLLALAVFVPYFVLLSLTGWAVVRYTLPLIPPGALLVAITARAALARARTPALIAGLLVATYTLGADLAYGLSMRGPDPREVAAAWIAGRVPEGATVGALSYFAADIGSNPPPVRGRRWLLARLEDFEALLARRLDYLVLNSTLIERKVTRLGQRNPSAVLRHLDAWLASQRRFTPVATFARAPRLLGIDFSTQFRSMDLQIPFERIVIYRARSGT